MNGRLKSIRKYLNMNQQELGKYINLSRSHISSLENGFREVTDRIISDYCREFNVNENWLRTGEGEMFVQQTEFSLDQYAEKNKLSPLEIDIMKSYMEVDANIREGIISHFKDIFARHAESAATVEDDRDIEIELEKTRLELEAEKKGVISSALDGTSDKNKETS